VSLTLIQNNLVLRFTAQQNTNHHFFLLLSCFFRRGLIAAWVGGSVLACGGQNNTKENNLCWKYHPANNSWSEVSPLAKYEKQEFANWQHYFSLERDILVMWFLQVAVW
jgi:hypothetical protein